MTTERASLGFGSELEQLDAWNPQPPSAPRPNQDAIRHVAAAAGFSSREPQLVRGRRTGRNMQLNLKARPDTIAAFCAIADANGWGLGETLEKAVELLEREPGRSPAR